MKKIAKLSLLALLCLSGFGVLRSHAQTAPTQRFTAAINGAQIAYTITGDAPETILLIHGYPLNGDLFAKQRRGLSARYRVITLDLRGFGGSVAPDDQGTIDLYARDVLGLLDQLGIQQAIIGGHSMGGAITLRLYELAPERFRAMFLNDAAAFPPPTVEQNMWIGYQQQAREPGGAASLLPLLLPEFLTGDARATRTSLVRKVSQQVLAASVNGLVGGAHALQTRPDFSTTFPNINVPTLILYGQEDSLTPMEQGQMLHTAIAGSELVIVPGASHGVIRQQPGVATAAILDWADRNLDGASATPQATPATSAD